MAPDPESDIVLSLRWKATWPGESETDFSGFAPTLDTAACRIYEVIQGPQRHRWFWAMCASDYDISRGGALTGYEDTPRQAAAAAEEAWQHAIRGSRHDLVLTKPPHVDNAYARARAGE